MVLLYTSGSEKRRYRLRLHDWKSCCLSEMKTDARIYKMFCIFIPETSLWGQDVLVEKKIRKLYPDQGEWLCGEERNYPYKRTCRYAAQTSALSQARWPLALIGTCSLCYHGVWSHLQDVLFVLLFNFVCVDVCKGDLCMWNEKFPSLRINHSFGMFSIFCMQC
jgi:hypothetical protein